jgi:uncharacterized membrane protein
MTEKVSVLKTEHYLTFVLFILHTVGIVGLTSPYKDLFLSLTPLNLLISTGIVIWWQRIYPKAFVPVLIFIYLLGFFIEVLGVNTGLIFGEYSYDRGLGFQLWGTPLMIGVNWLMLVLASAAAARRVPTNNYLQALIAALLMVLLDLLIEPVSSKLEFWTWKDNLIPKQNYYAWFVVAYIMQSVYFHFRLDVPNKVGQNLFLILIYFFALLNFVLI